MDQEEGKRPGKESGMEGFLPRVCRSISEFSNRERGRRHYGHRRQQEPQAWRHQTAKDQGEMYDDQIATGQGERPR